MIKREIDIFFATLMFYTRIPVPKETSFSDDVLNKTTRYFTLAGAIIGAIGGGTFWLLNFVTPLPLALVLSMITTILITGAFHEDGFADTCDGFGGGYTKERVLEIMKDSRIGTYGAIGLLLMLLTKFISLSNTPVAYIPLVIFCGHAFSRFWPVCMLYTQKYVRPSEQSKSKPVGHKAAKGSFWIAALFGIAPLPLLPWKAVIISIIICALVFFIFSIYTRRRIGGYTGDVLGALQQLCEISFYIGFLVYIEVCL